MNQIPAVSLPTTAKDDSESRSATQITARGEFLHSAHGIITTPHAVTPRGEDFEPARPAAADSRAFDALGAEPLESNVGVGALAANTEEVQDAAAIECANIMAEFAGLMAYARMCLSGPQLAAVLQALKEACKAALARVKQSAAQELAGRKKAAIMARRRAAKSGRTPRPRPLHGAPGRS